ncbi:MAG TPA: hypothetical protein VNH63_07315 [Gemmatimonadales bacterium]|nr:hypothetical protein [Gemmatimonadales bacterium]
MRMHLAALALTGAALVSACDQNRAGPPLSADLTGASQPMSLAFSMPVTVHTSTNMSTCDNSPGPYITISGGVALSGLGTRLAFTNNEKGTHTYTDQNSATLTVIPAGQSITIPKQPVLGGVGGNPFIWIQLTDDRDTPLTNEIYLGRCVQGVTKDVDANFSLPANAVASIATEGCYNNPGPTITLSGDFTLRPGLGARMIFRNNDNPVGGPHEFDDATVVRANLVPPGEDVSFPKQPVLGGVGGNPWIWFQFLSASGADLMDPALVGRCVQLNNS